MVSRFQRDRAREKAGTDEPECRKTLRTKRRAPHSLPAACVPLMPAHRGRARELEAMGFLQITLVAGEKISWSGGFAVQP
jgi:hypothetical protein